MRYLLFILLFACKEKSRPVTTIPGKPVIVIDTVGTNLGGGAKIDPIVIEKIDTPELLSRPLKFNWKDRRPIGMIMLASFDGSFKLHNQDNYVFDVTNFKESLLSFADRCIENMKALNAQGMITWDLEGQRYAHPASYIGDPRFLNNEMNEVADEYFNRFKQAGFKVGICVRPDSIAYNKDSTWIDHYSVEDQYKNLETKIQYAIDRWGCSIFYIDSNIWPGQAGVIAIGGDGMSWWVFKRLHDRFPKVLLIPEWQEWNYFQVTAPFYSSAEGTILLSAEHKRLLPNSFLVAAVDQSSTEIEESVKQGNVMLFAAWWKDPIHHRIKLAYENFGQGVKAD